MNAWPLGQGVPQGSTKLEPGLTRSGGCLTEPCGTEVRTLVCVIVPARPPLVLVSECS